MRTDRWTDMTNLIVAFRNFGKGLKLKQRYLIVTVTVCPPVSDFDQLNYFQYN